MHRRLIRTFTITCLLILAATGRPVAAEPASPIDLKNQAVADARKGDYSNALSMMEKALSISDRDPTIIYDYIVILFWAGRADDAVKEYETLPPESEKPAYVQTAVAKCYRDQKQFEKAGFIYEAAIKINPSDTKAIAGLALTLIDRHDYTNALNVATSALSSNPDNIDLLFATAFAYQENKDFIMALKTYDHLLERDPANPDVINLKTRLLSDIGACSPAQEFADTQKEFITTETKVYLASNMAAKRINWGEHSIATNIFAELIAGEPEPMQRLRPRFDRILALAAMEKMDEVIEEYEPLVETGINIPYWIHDAAANAYLFQRNPKKAIELYKKVLELKPDRFDTRLGLYFAYIETEQFKEAGKVRDQLDKETPEWVITRGVSRYNWNKQRVDMEEGWWLLYQNRLKEGEAFFNTMQDKAPANLATRNGIGTAAAWRGRPHQALEEFDVLITMAGQQPYEVPDYVQEREISAKNARTTALNECYLKKEARSYGAELLARNGNNLHTQRINRQLNIDDSTEFYLDVLWTDENPGVRDDYIYAQLTQPITTDLDLYAFWLNRRTFSQNENNFFEYKRAGFGANMNLIPQITVKGELSKDRNSSSDKGISTRLTYRIDDYWSMEAGHNTFSLDVPIRARAEGLTGKQTDGAIIYRSSELFNARAVYSLNRLDDSNENASYSLYAERGLITRAHWKTRLFAEASESMNSRTDVNYFSPKTTTTYALTHLIDHTIYRRYERSFVHRLYLGIGQFDQSLYSPDFIWHGRYEQDYAFSEKTVLLWGVNFQRRFYDSEQTNTLSWYLTFRKNF